MKIRILATLLLICAAHTATAQDREVIPYDVARMTDSLRSIYAPDSRTAIFDTEYTFAEHHVTVRGRTTSAECRQALYDALGRAGYETEGCMRLLPDAKLGTKTYAVVRLSVCNMRSAPDFSAEMVSQALMGMPVRVLDRDGWYLIQTPDNYIAWVHPAAIELMDAQCIHEWNAAEKLVVTSHYGFVRTEAKDNAATVSDIVAGDRLRLTGQKGRFYAVAYPDGRTGYVSKADARPETEWRKTLRRDAEAITATAQTLTGVPYIWAGTSSKGMDCSGFVRTVLYMHDIVIPRDASQQALTGERIEIAEDLSNLDAGDLLFFGRKATAGSRERVVHVGIYIGGGRFIHSQGDVRTGSLDARDELFDSYNLSRLLFAARILPYIDMRPQLCTTPNNPYYRF